jgi:hypothetical protein
MSGSYDFVPDTFTWNAGLTYDQIRQNLLQPDAPGNRENQVMLSTGPTLRARLAENFGAELDGHYTRLGYSRRPADNETVGGRFLIGLLNSPRMQFALGASYDDVSYVSSGAPAGLDYRRREVFSRFGANGARTQIDVEAGYSRISGAIADQSGPVLRARMSRKVSSFITAFIQATREYPTSDAQTPAAQQLSGSTYDTTPLSAGPRLNIGASAGVTYSRLRTQADIAVSSHKEDARQTGSGIRHYNELRVRVSRELTPRTQGALYGSLTDEDLRSAAPGRKAQESIVGASLALGFGRSTSVDFRVEHRQRDGRVANDSYSEFSGGIYLRYGGLISGR